MSNRIAILEGYGRAPKGRVRKERIVARHAKKSHHKRRGKRKGGGGSQRAKFGRAAKAAMDSCLKGIAAGNVSATRSGYGSCMRKEMKKRL